MSSAAAPAKEKQIGLVMTGALVVGIMIGSGIFLLPPVLAPLGINAIIAWPISSAGALCIGFALARLSALGGDGIQANIERELGGHVAYLVAFAFWVSNWTAQAGVAIAGASALSWLNPAFAGPGFVIPVAIGSVVLFTAVNSMGARASGGMSVVTVAIKVLPLLAVVVVLALRLAGGSAAGPLEPLAPKPLSLDALSGAVTLSFFALTGFENATTPVGKVRDPARTIPRAIMGGVVAVAILYLIVSTAVQLLLPADVVAASPAPIAETIMRQWGNGLAMPAAIAIAIAAFGCLNGLILGTGELGYAMGLRRDLPFFMAWTRGGNTPVGSQLVAGVLTIALILASNSQATTNLFAFIVLLSTSAVLVVYAAGAIAAWRLSPTIGARAAIVVALLFVGFALYGSGLEPDLWCLALLAAGVVIRFGMHLVAGRAGDAVAEAGAPTV